MTTTSGIAQISAPAPNTAIVFRIATTEDTGDTEEDPVACTTRSISNGTVSHATCDRMPVARPARKPAAYSLGDVVAPSVIACTATAAASPGISLSGRALVNQYRGDVIATSVAASGHGARSRSAILRIRTAIATTPSAPATALRTLSAVNSEPTSALINFATSM